MVVKINIKMKETVARYRMLYTSRVVWIPPFLGDSDHTYQPGAAELGGDVNNPSHRLAPGSLVCQMGLGIASWYTILLHQDGNASSTVPTEPTPFPGKYRRTTTSITISKFKLCEINPTHVFFQCFHDSAVGTYVIIPCKSDRQK